MARRAHVAAMGVIVNMPPHPWSTAAFSYSSFEVLGVTEATNVNGRVRSGHGPRH